MRGPKDPLARFVSGLVLPAIEDSDIEVDTETAADGYSTIVRLPKSDDDLYHLVSSVLKPSVWWRTERTSGPKPRSARTRVEWLPRWSGLEGVAGDDVPRLLDAWRRATFRRGVPDFIRVSVNPYERSDLLRVAARAGQPVVPSVRWLSGVAFTWHYPIRVAVAGASESRLLRELRGLPGAGRDFVVSQEHPDVCFVRGDDDGPLPDCGTVLAVGRGKASDLFSWAIWNRRSPNGVAVAAGVPRNDLSWWPETVNALTQNMPLDCALASVVPDACVGGISAALTTTTLGHEAAGWRGSAIDTRFVGPGTLPDMEGEGPELGESVPASPRKLNAEGVEAPGVTDQRDQRRLVLEFRDGTKRVRTVLPPNRELTLQIAVGLARRGQPAGSEPVVVPHPEEPVVTLDVVAHCNSWSEPQRSQVALLVHNYDQASTSAILTFVTPDPGAMVITIDLLYRGRVIQQADIVAAVRDRALPGERIRVEVRHTSATTRSTADPAELCLDATGSELRNIWTEAAVPLAPLSDVLDAFEDQVSRVLGVDEPPETLDDERARKLLIALARRGVGLRDQLAGLGLSPPTGTTVSVAVQEQTRVLPFELVYEGGTPKRGARLCTHVTAPPPLGEGCDRTSPKVVCPYAFWSLNRVIVRTVVLTGTPSRRTPEPLRLTPVLFAASNRADRGSPSQNHPSDALEQACRQLLKDVTRVHSWPAWKRQVRAARPELLVLLAHTEVSEGEASVQIGLNSLLLRPDITAAMVGNSPLVLLAACASAVAGDPFGTLAGTLTARGAAAVVGLLTKLSGDHGSRAAVAVLTALCSTSSGSLSSALALARRDLVAQGLLVGILVVAHGEIDVSVQSGDTP